MKITRRGFLATAARSSAAVALASAAVEHVAAQDSAMPNHAMPNHSAQDHSMPDHAAHNHEKPQRPEIPRLPAILCRKTGTVSIDAGYDDLKRGADTLDAALHIVREREDDPNDTTVGVGGLPNLEGEVQLDACCFHGPSRREAAVGGVSGVRNACMLARAVMEQTGYSLLTGQDAERFGVEHGFVRQDLGTERTRKAWTLWKNLRASGQPGKDLVRDPRWPAGDSDAPFLPASQEEFDRLISTNEPLAAQVGLGPQYTWRTVYDALFPQALPLYVAAVNEKQEISCASSTSGLPWRRAGATSDIATLGAGCYLDPDVGSAGASGDAGANIKVTGAHSIVENMRQGMPPEAAGMDVLKRIAQWHKNDMNALRFVDIVYYILRKDGAYASVSLWRGDRTGHVQQFTIHDGVRRSEDCVYLFDGNPVNGVLAPRSKNA